MEDKRCYFCYGSQHCTTNFSLWNCRIKLHFYLKLEELLNPTESRLMPPQASQSIFDLTWPWSLTFAAQLLWQLAFVVHLS